MNQDEADVEKEIADLQTKLGKSFASFTFFLIDIPAGLLSIFLLALLLCREWEWFVSPLLSEFGYRSPSLHDLRSISLVAGLLLFVRTIVLSFESVRKVLEKPKTNSMKALGYSLLRSIGWLFMLLIIWIFHVLT